jgi:hypothetical protein
MTEIFSLAFNATKIYINTPINTIGMWDRQRVKAIAPLISGPCVLVHMKGLGKDIYLFGEVHGPPDLKSTDTVHIFDYLQILFRTTGIFIDFYLETNIQKDYTEREDDNILRNLGDMFRTCFETVSECNLGYSTRFHHVDVRSHLERYPSCKIGPVYDILDIPKDNPKVKSAFMKMFDNCKLVKKELKRSTLGEKKIKDLMWTLIKEDLYGSKLLLRSGDGWRPPIGSESGVFYMSDIAAVALLLDIYTIARIFKKFKRPKPYQPEEPTNIIFYGGVGHTKNIVKVLSLLGMEIVEEYGNMDFPESNRYVDMRGIKQPFFT